MAQERQQEMMIRRQLELEHSRREQELARRMQEATTRETRSAFLTELKSKEILMQVFIIWSLIRAVNAGLVFVA